jgi:hypothetical protein
LILLLSWCVVVKAALCDPIHGQDCVGNDIYHINSVPDFGLDL